MSSLDDEAYELARAVDRHSRLSELEHAAAEYEEGPVAGEIMPPEGCEALRPNQMHQFKTLLSGYDSMEASASRPV